MTEEKKDVGKMKEGKKSEGGMSEEEFEERAERAYRRMENIHPATGEELW